MGSSCAAHAWHPVAAAIDVNVSGYWIIVFAADPLSRMARCSPTHAPRFLGGAFFCWSASRSSRRQYHGRCDQHHVARVQSARSDRTWPDSRYIVWRVWQAYERALHIAL